MKLRLKLFLGILFIAFIASGATGSYFYVQAKNAMLDSIRQQLMATAKMASLLVHGDVLQTLTRPEQMTSSEYLEIQDLMGVIAQSNSEYLFAYTMRLDHGLVRFIVDSPPHDDDGDGIISEDEMPEPLGAIYPDPPDAMLEGFVRASGDPRPHTDQWATTMSGYAPIFNSTGQAVGLIGIDMSLNRVQAKLSAIRQAGLISLLIATSMAIFMGWRMSRRIFQPLAQLQDALVGIGKGDYSRRLNIQGNDEISVSARNFNKMAAELQEKNWMKSTLGKMVGKEIAQQITENRLQLGGEIQSATILVCDLRGFSLLSEKLPPKLLVGLINDYFTAMVDIVQQYGGIVDKFVGDMILAVFGHPVPLEHEQQCALDAARKMLAKCDELNITLHLGEDLHLENSIALHTGPVLAGIIGSPDRMEYTIMGQPVNMAVRLERLTRDLHVRLAASADFVNDLDGKDGMSSEHNLVHVGKQKLPGMHHVIDVYVSNGRGKDDTRTV